MTNHPVHILDDKNELSPSAFIPFCSFGENMESMGTYIEGFDVPVCNSFKAKVHNDQLCYEVDLEKFKNKENMVSQLGYGLIMILDYNEEKQFIGDYKKRKGNYKNIFVSEKQNSVRTHLNTIGTNDCNYISLGFYLILQIFLSQIRSSC